MSIQNKGKITQVIGPVVDVRFESDLPEIDTALAITSPALNDEPDNLIVEVAQHLGENTEDAWRWIPPRVWFAARRPEIQESRSKCRWGRKLWEEF